jgi:hypothetical protein
MGGVFSIPGNSLLGCDSKHWGKREKEGSLPHQSPGKGMMRRLSDLRRPAGHNYSQKCGILPYSLETNQQLNKQTKNLQLPCLEAYQPSIQLYLADLLPNESLRSLHAKALSFCSIVTHMHTFIFSLKKLALGERESDVAGSEAIKQSLGQMV